MFIKGFNYEGTMEEAMKVKELGRVGCVYPNDDKSYYISSNLNPEKTICVNCTDGYFYLEKE